MVSRKSKFATILNIRSYLVYRIFIFCREKLAKIKEIRQNIHESIFELAMASERLQISLDVSQRQEAIRFVIGLGRFVPQEMTDVSKLTISIYLCSHQK